MKEEGGRYKRQELSDRAVGCPAGCEPRSSIQEGEASLLWQRPETVPRRNFQFRDFQMIIITALIHGVPGTALNALHNASLFT